MFKVIEASLVHALLFYLDTTLGVGFDATYLIDMKKIYSITTNSPDSLFYVYQCESVNILLPTQSAHIQGTPHYYFISTHIIEAITQLFHCSPIYT